MLLSKSGFTQSGLILYLFMITAKFRFVSKGNTHVIIELGRGIHEHWQIFALIFISIPRFRCSVSGSLKNISDNSILNIKIFLVLLRIIIVILRSMGLFHYLCVLVPKLFNITIYVNRIKGFNIILYCMRSKRGIYGGIIEQDMVVSHVFFRNRCSRKLGLVKLYIPVIENCRINLIIFHENFL